MHQEFAVGLNARKEQVGGQRLVDEEEVIIAVRQHHGLAVLGRVVRECVHDVGEAVRTSGRRRIVGVRLNHEEEGARAVRRIEDLLQPGEGGRLAPVELLDPVDPGHRTSVAGIEGVRL